MNSFAVCAAFSSFMVGPLGIKLRNSDVKPTGLTAHFV